MQWLIVDADRGSRARLGEQLVACDVSVVHAESAIRALARFEWPVTFVASALALPEGATAGLALLELARDLAPECTRVLVVPERSELADSAVLDGRASWVLTQPVSLAELHAVVTWARTRAA